MSPYFILRVFFLNKSSGSCNDTNNTKLCVPDVVKNMKVKVFIHVLCVL